MQTIDESKLDQHQRSRLETLRAYERIARDPSRRIDGKDHTAQAQRELDNFVAQLCKEQAPKPAPVDTERPSIKRAREQLLKAQRAFERQPNDRNAFDNLKSAELELERVKAVALASEKAAAEQLAAEQLAEKEQRAAERAAVVAKGRARGAEIEAAAIEHLIAACAAWKELYSLGNDGVDANASVRRINDHVLRVITTREDLRIPAGVLMAFARGF